MNTAEIVAFQIKANLPRLSDEVSMAVAKDVVSALVARKRIVKPRTTQVPGRCTGTECGRATRPRGSLAAEYPGTIAMGAGTLCMTCYMRSRDNGRKHRALRVKP